MYKHLYSTTVEVDVDVCADDLTDDDLREICEERGLMSGGVSSDVIEELYTHFKLGRHDAVLERVRVLVQDAKGVIL